MLNFFLETLIFDEFIDEKIHKWIFLKLIKILKMTIIILNGNGPLVFNHGNTRICRAQVDADVYHLI